MSHPLDVSAARPPRARRRFVTTIVAALVAVLVSPLAASSPAAASTAVPARTWYENYIGGVILKTINHERALHALRPVTMSSQLKTSARRHNLTMARYNTMSHQLPGEPYFTQRIDASGYRWTYAGENIGWNSRISTAAVVQLELMMYNEVAPNDGHRQNILNSHYKNVGVDVYWDHAHHKLWLTTDYGRL